MCCKSHCTKVTNWGPKWKILKGSSSYTHKNPPLLALPDFEIQSEKKQVHWEKAYLVHLKLNSQPECSQFRPPSDVQKILEIITFLAILCRLSHHTGQAAASSVHQALGYEPTPTCIPYEWLTFLRT